MIALSEVVSEFETIMREYIDLHCISTNGAQCVKPDLRFGMSAGGYFLDFTTTAVTHPPSGCFDEEGAGWQCCVNDDCDSDDQKCDLGWCVDKVKNVTTGEPTTSTTLHGDPTTTETYTTLTGDPITTSTDEPTTTLHGDPTTTVGAPLDPCAGVVCRGSQVCNNGICARPSSGSSDGGCRGSQVCTNGACGRASSSGGSSGSSGSGSSDGGCSSDTDCRGSQVCTNGACGRASSSGGSSGSSGSGCSSDGDCR